MTTPLSSFQQYQRAFTARIRDPKSQPIPAGVAAERMAIYDEIVFNNLLEAVSACFPVARKTIGKTSWLKLVRTFVKEHSANTPLFREIPEEFLAFLSQTNLALPPYLQALCHYEWIELYISSLPALDTPPGKGCHDLAQQSLKFNPTIQLLSYDYAVHKISPRYKPKHQEPTYLLAHRNIDDKIEFTELNAITFKFISLLITRNITVESALRILNDEFQDIDPSIMLTFGLELIEDLKKRGIIETKNQRL